MNSPHSPTTRRVLVVDDDPVSLAIAAVLLEAEGCAILQAESGQQALDLLSADRESPDCILADLRMPGLAGADLAMRLRQAAPHACLLAMSASPPQAVQGYDGILTKPLSPESLSAALAPQPRISRSPNGRAPRGRLPDTDGVLDLRVFDRLQRAMASEALEEVVSIFLSDTRARILKMRSADPETLRREAHTVKGGAAMVGALQVSLAAAAVESGIDDPGARSRKLDEMEAHTHQAETILRQRLQA